MNVVSKNSKNEELIDAINWDFMERTYGISKAVKVYGEIYKGKDYPEIFNKHNIDY